MKMKLTVAIAMSILSIISCTGVRVNGKSLTDIINNSVNGNVSISIGESGIDASDNYTTRTVRIESLKGIKTGGVFEVKYTTGEPSLTIYAPDNVQEHIITRLENGILTVKTDGTKFKGSWDVTLNVSSPTLEMLDLSGACEFEAESGVRADNLDIDLSGAVEVDIDGLKAEEVSIKGSGASDIEHFRT